MKNIVRILIIATLALLPTLSQAKELKIGYDEIIELSKLGLIDNTDVERYIDISLNIQKDHLKNIRYFYSNFSEGIIIILGFIIVGIVIILISKYVIRFYTNKNIREKEFLLKLVEQDLFTKVQPRNLEILFKGINKKNIIEPYKFIIDASLMGVGFGIWIAETRYDFFELISYIMFFYAFCRIIIRVVFLTIDLIKNNERNSVKTIETSSETKEEQQ